jgi:hypothetical protein
VLYRGSAENFAKQDFFRNAHVVEKAQTAEKNPCHFPGYYDIMYHYSKKQELKK